MAMEIVILLIMLFVGISIFMSIHLCIVGRAFRSDDQGQRNINSSSNNNSSSVATKRAPCGGNNVDDLRNLPCFDYEEIVSEACINCVSGTCKNFSAEGGCRSPLVECAVCLESYKAGDACRLLPNCSHSFHVQCIDSWILKTPFCPICRTRVHNRSVVPKFMREESDVSAANVEIEMA